MRHSMPQFGAWLRTLHFGRTDTIKRSVFVFLAIHIADSKRAAKIRIIPDKIHISAWVSTSFWRFAFQGLEWKIVSLILAVNGAYNAAAPPAVRPIPPSRSMINER